MFSDRCFTASEVARGKPAPDLFLHAAIQMNEQPFACTVVEDSLPGIQAARSAGMRALAYVGATHSDVAALQAAGGRTFDSMSSLPMLAWVTLAETRRALDIELGRALDAVAFDHRAAVKRALRDG